MICVKPRNTAVDKRRLYTHKRNVIVIVFVVRQAFKTMNELYIKSHGKRLGVVIYAFLS